MKRTSKASGSVLTFSAVEEDEVAEKGAGLTPTLPDGVAHTL